MLFLFSRFHHELQVEFSNVNGTEGVILVAVYDRSENFLNTEKVCAKKIIQVKNTGNLKVSLGHLPPGQYALTCFHDLKGNGMLDTNMFGIPQEPYGFSNNARSLLGPPTFSKAAFDVSENTASMDISVR